MTCSQESLATYTIQDGDNLNKIANTCQLKLSSLQAANTQLPSFDLIYPGQHVIIIVVVIIIIIHMHSSQVLWSSLVHPEAVNCLPTILVNQSSMSQLDAYRSIALPPGNSVQSHSVLVQMDFPHVKNKCFSAGKAQQRHPQKCHSFFASGISFFLSIICAGLKKTAYIGIQTASNFCSLSIQVIRSVCHQTVPSCWAEAFCQK